jgi:hypothetical protein
MITSKIICSKTKQDDNLGEPLRRTSTACLRFAPHLWVRLASGYPLHHAHGVRFAHLLARGSATIPLAGAWASPMRVSAARAPRRRSAASSSKYAGILVSSTCYLIPEPRSGDTCYHSPILHTSYFIFQKHSFLSSAFFNQKKWNT